MLYYSWYKDFMEADDNDFLINDEEETPEDDKPSGNLTYYLRDHVQIPIVREKLKQQSVKNQIISWVGKFLDENATKLATTGPVYIIPFLDDKANFFYILFDTTRDEITTHMNAMKGVAFTDPIKDKDALINVKNSPHKILFTAILIEALQNNYEDIIECCRFLFAFTDYAIIYRSYWRFGVKEEVMNYTIENLPSNKFLAKKLNNILELLKYQSNKALECYTKRLMTGADRYYIDFTGGVRTRINNTFRNIAHFYYDNNDNNLAQIVQKTHYDDGKLVEMEGQHQIISAAVEKSLNGFMTKEVEQKIVRVISQGGELDPGTLTTFLNQIINDKRNKLERFVESLITAFFQAKPIATTVNSAEFVNFGIGLYRSISTSKKELYMDLKNILNFWINDIIDIKKYFKGSTTISNYSRGIFNYIVLMINHYN